MNDIIKLLIIDDSDDDRLLYRRTLQKSTDTVYDIIEASDGETGMACVQDKPPSCVLLDYSLPGRNGVEVLKRMRSQHPFLPIIILTGQGNENVAVAAMQQGAQNYILKSTIELGALEHVIHMAIEHCTLQKHVHDQRAALEVFTRALAHDLNEPVRTIRSYIELIGQSGSFSDKVRKYIQHVQQAADRMRMLIDTVFMYTRLDDPAQANKELCNLTEIFGEVKDNISHLMSERRAVVTSASLPVVYANRIQMIQLMQNIICNAIKHSDKPVTVNVLASALDDDWVIRIRDNGPGIDSTYFKKIFEPFKRMASHEEHGAGLGLAICKKIVESHDGRIWCESEVGKGTTFLFSISRTLPVMEKNDAVLPEDVAPTSDVKKADRPLANVLLVDDSRADTEMFRFRLLERSHLQCNLFVARSGEEALQRLDETSAKEQPIDLVLLDINMPEMDGFEVLEKIRKHTGMKKLSVVMCSGSTYDKDMQRAKEMGAVGYLTKPIEFAKLKSLIDATPTFHLQQENSQYILRRAA